MNLLAFLAIMEVTVVTELHHNAEHHGFVLVESFMVARHIWVTDRCQNYDFIERVLLLFFAEFLQLHLFECVGFLVTFPDDLVHFREGAGSKFLDIFSPF